MHRLGLPAILLLAGTHIVAQQQSGAGYAVRGSVVNALTGEPVRRALVELNGPERHTTFSGSDGQFQIDGVQAGNYSAGAVRPGFGANRFNPVGRNSRDPNVSMVTVGQSTQTVVIKLMPLAKISGRVLDREGEPIPNLAIQCYAQVMIFGRNHWQSTNGVSTDENGDFLIDNMAPGSYLIETAQKLVYPGTVSNDEVTRLIYPRQFYPNSPDRMSAQPMVLKPGEDARLDLSLSTVRGTRVFFSMTPDQRAMVSLADANGEEVHVPVQLSRNEESVVPAIPPGSYRLIARSTQGEKGLQLYGETPIEVGRADLKGVQVALFPAAEIPVVISGDTESATGPAQVNGHPAGRMQAVNVQLISTSQNMNRGIQSASPSTDRQDGGLSIRGVTPGSYQVRVNVAGMACIDSMTSGSADLTHNELVVSAGATPPPIHITLRNDCASLDVTTNQPTDQPAMILIASDARMMEPRMVYSAGGGKVSVANLSPGDYQVYAFTDFTGIEYGNPDALRSFNGQRVTLTANQKVAVTVDVNLRGNN